MKNFLFVCMVIILWIPTSLAQEATPEVEQMYLVPFTLPAVPYSGVVPATWTDIQEGIAIRPEEDSVSTTYIVHVAIPFTPLDQALEPLLIPMGIDALPAPDGTFTGNAFIWTTYTLSYESPQGDALIVNIATSETEEGSFVIALQSTPDEEPELKGSVFFPAMLLFGTERELLNELLNIPALETTTLNAFGIDSAFPTGWEMLNEGVYGRGDPLIDATTLLIQTSPDLSESEFAALFLERLSITQDLGEAIEIYSTDILTWSIYSILIPSDTFTIRMNLATANDGELTYLAALLTDESEADLLIETILKPILDATKPTESD